MPRRFWRALSGFLMAAGIPGVLPAQTELSWDQILERFKRNNASLLAGETFVQEQRANEVTAGLRPNPQLTFVSDQFHVFNPNPLRPFQNAQITPVVSQLFERRHKRQLRQQSAQLQTSISTTDLADQERQLTFNLKDSFNKTLQAKAVLDLARENIAYYDKVIDVNRQRFKAGDIARVDLDRVELQRVQFESDLVNAQVNLRTAKIQLLALMNDRTPLDRFDVRGNFDFQERILLLDELRRTALDARPDLQSARTTIAKARSDYRLAWANGSTDPDFGLEYQRSGPDNTMGLSVTIPLRIFDRNQGEKARTQLEIRRSEQLRDAAEIGILRDVDSAYESLVSVVTLLRPYRDRYLPQAASVRETVSFSYQRGGASLLEFLDAQKSYRDTHLNYLNLIESYLSSANQLSLAVGREVLP